MKSIEQLKKKDLNCNIFSVYDYDGLTITELLCQFFTKINECIDISNETIDLAKWLVNEGLEIEVAKKLVMWLEDGTLENIINVNLFNTLNEKINGLSSQLEHIEKKINYSVLDFGAKGDGLTDDTKAIQDTIDYVRDLGGGKVLIPKTNGDYIISNNIFLYSNITLEFEGSYLKLIEKTTTGAIITRDLLTPKVTNVRIINPLLNGNNILGQNGVGFGNNVEDIRVEGGHIINCKRDAYIGGGRAITFQLGTRNCYVSDFVAENCTTAYDCHGTLEEPSIGNIVNNLNAYNCDEVLSFYNLEGLGSRDIKAINCIVNNVTARNCGTLDGGLVVIERASNIKVNNMICLNDNSHSKIGGIVRGKMYDCEFNNISFNGQLLSILNGKGASNIQPVTSNNNAPCENIKMKDIITYGSVDYGIISGTGSSTILKDIKIEGECENITKIFDDLAKVKTTVYVDIKNKTLNKRRCGFANLLNAYADIDFSKTESEIEYVFKKIGDFNISRGSTGASIGTTDNTDIVIKRNNNDMIQFTDEGTKIVHSSWDGRHLIMGNWHFWIDTNGDLRYSNTKPTSSLYGKKVLTE